jgi:hypothetical protein
MRTPLCLVLRAFAAWIVAAGVVGCSGGGGMASAPAGTLRVSITDAAACGFDHVWVTVQKVSVNANASAPDNAAGWADVTVSPPQRIDLLSLTNGMVQLLGQTQLPSGHYAVLRLGLAPDAPTSLTPPNAVQPTGGAVVAVTTDTSTLRVPASIDVPVGQIANIVIDFDACQSVVPSGNTGQFILRPVFTVVPVSTSGIQGFVDLSMVTSATTVAAQSNGVTVRSTTPALTGQFSIPFLNTGTYSLIVSAEGHATGVVTGVVVGTATTVVNASGTGITTPLSAMADVSGAVTVSAASGGTSIATTLTSATVTATQALTGGPAIELRRQPVDASLGTYDFHLPVGAPVRAAWVSQATSLDFAPDTFVAGKYVIGAQAPDRSPLAQPADISSGQPATVNFAF